MSKKTTKDSLDELDEIWRDLIDTLARSLHIDKALDYLSMHENVRIAVMLLLILPPAAFWAWFIVFGIR